MQEGDDKIEYRAWNPFRSKLAAAILGGVDQIHIKPGAKVLYLGAASGTTVSHVSDIVGPVSRRRDRKRWEGGKGTQRPWLPPCTEGLGSGRAWSPCLCVKGALEPHGLQSSIQPHT